MNPTPGDVHVNSPLTNVSVGFLQNASSFIATRVFPNVPVSKQSDLYYTYDRGEFNRDEMELRAPGAESAGGGWKVGQDSYFCPVWAFHKDIPDQLRSNADSQFKLDSEATQYVTGKALIKREKIWTASYFTTGIWTFGRAGVASGPVAGTSVLQWNDAASDPITDVRLARRVILQSTGFMPNKITLGREVYDTLIDHPDIIDRLKYGQTASKPAMANAADLARLFELEEVLVMDAVENTAKEGQTPVHSFIGGKHALLTYSPPMAGLMTPTAGYTFSWTGHLGAQADGQRIKSFRMENLAADRVEIEMAFATKRVAADLGFILTSIVA